MMGIKKLREIDRLLPTSHTLHTELSIGMMYGSHYRLRRMFQTQWGTKFQCIQCSPNDD